MSPSRLAGDCFATTASSRLRRAVGWPGSSMSARSKSADRLVEIAAPQEAETTVVERIRQPRIERDGLVVVLQRELVVALEAIDASRLHVAHRVVGTGLDQRRPGHDFIVEVPAVEDLRVARPDRADVFALAGRPSLLLGLAGRRLVGRSTSMDWLALARPLPGHRQRWRDERHQPLGRALGRARRDPRRRGKRRRTHARRRRAHDRRRRLRDSPGGGARGSRTALAIRLEPAFLAGRRRRADQTRREAIARPNLKALWSPGAKCLNCKISPSVQLNREVGTQPTAASGPTADLCVNCGGRADRDTFAQRHRLLVISLRMHASALLLH